MPKLIHFLKGVLLPFFQKRKKAVAAAVSYTNLTVTEKVLP